MKKRFCEGCWVDGKKFTSAVLHVDGRDLCLVCIRAEGLNVEDGVAIPIEEVAQVDPRIVKDQKARRKLQAVPGPEIQNESESEMGKHLCECGCGGEVKAEGYARGWRYVRGHKPNGGCVTPPVEKKPKTTVQVRKQALPNIVSDPAYTRYTMAVSAQFLERAWERLTPELKAVAIAAALEC